MGTGAHLPARHKVSLIVPALDEEKYVGRLIESANGQTEPFYEYIVVNSGNDATEAIATEMGATVVSCPAGNISAARNAGAKVASGDILVFADADIHLASDFLETCVDELREGYALVFPREVIYDSWGWNAWAWGVQWMRSGNSTTRCVAVWKEACDAVGGYDIDCNPKERGDAFIPCREDLDFGNRIAELYGHESLKILRPLIATSARRYKAFGMTGIWHFDEAPRRYLDWDR